MEQFEKEFLNANQYFEENKYKKSYDSFRFLIENKELVSEWVDISEIYKKLIKLSGWLNNKESETLYMKDFAFFLFNEKKYTEAVENFKAIIKKDEFQNLTSIMPTFFKALMESGEMGLANDYANLYLKYLYGFKRVNAGLNFLNIYRGYSGEREKIWINYKLLFSCLILDVDEIDRILSLQSKKIDIDAEVVLAIQEISTVQNATSNIINVCLREYLSDMNNLKGGGCVLEMQKKFINLLYDYFLKFKTPAEGINYLIKYFRIFSILNPINSLDSIITTIDKKNNSGVIKEINEGFALIKDQNIEDSREVQSINKIKEIKEFIENKKNREKTVFQMEINANFLKNIGKESEAKKIIEQIKEIDAENTFVDECSSLLEELHININDEHTVLFKKLQNVFQKGLAEEKEHYIETSRRALRRYLSSLSNEHLEEYVIDFVISFEMFKLFDLAMFCISLCHERGIFKTNIKNMLNINYLEIEILIKMTSFSTAFEKVEQVLTNNTLNEDELICFTYLKAEILNFIGESVLAEQLYQKIYDKNSKYRLVRLRLDRN